VATLALVEGPYDFSKRYISYIAKRSERIHAFNLAQNNTRIFVNYGN
jgi:hypothetical protein